MSWHWVRINVAIFLSSTSHGGGGSLKMLSFFPVIWGCHLLSESADDVVLVCTDILERTGRESNDSCLACRYSIWQWSQSHCKARNNSINYNTFPAMLEMSWVPVSASLCWLKVSWPSQWGLPFLVVSVRSPISDPDRDIPINSSLGTPFPFPFPSASRSPPAPGLPLAPTAPDPPSLLIRLPLVLCWRAT